MFLLKTLFLTLNTFSLTGGIEKVCRIAGKALYEINREELAIFSLHDNRQDTSSIYFPQNIFRAFNGKKAAFLWKTIGAGIRSRIVILSHINLLLPGYIIKIVSPKTKLVLIAHGIEVWKPLSIRKKKMVQKVDIILPVSNYTKNRMAELNSIAGDKFSVLNNCLDPFLPKPGNMVNRDEYRNKYGISKNDHLLMTLSRLTSKEKNKGYDKVLLSIKQLQHEYPNIKYLFVGKYEEGEKQRLEIMANDLGIAGTLIFAGFVPDNEIAAYYNMTDVYIIPSEKEGFGISFIEAMYYNKPVIAGNRDGSVDALLNGALGILIDPGSQNDITSAIKKCIENVNSFTPDRKLLLENFSYLVYKQNWKVILNELNKNKEHTAN